MIQNIIIGLVLLGILVGVAMVFTNSVETKMIKLRKEAKDATDKLAGEKARADQAVKNEQTTRFALEQGDKKYNNLRTVVKVINDNPILYLRVLDKEGELKTPTLRLAAKGDNNNYTAFAYNGGEDLTDKLVLLSINGRSLSETLTDI